MRYAAAALMVFATSLMAVPAIAEDVLDPWQDSWSCGANVALDKTIVNGVLERGNLLGFDGSKTVPPFVIGTLDLVGGTYLFSKRDGAWSLTPLFQAAGPKSAHVSPAGAVVIVSWHTVGDPGAHSTAYSGEGLADFLCNEIPDGVVHPDYWDLSDLNGEAQSFTVIGTIHRLNSDAEEWSSLQTADGGVHWSEPKALAETPRPLEGSYTAVGPANPALIDELRNAF